MNLNNEDGILFDGNQDQEPQIMKTDNFEQLGKQFLKGQSLSNEFHQLDLVNKVDLSQDSIPGSQSGKETPPSHVRSKTQKEPLSFPKNQSILISSNSRSSKQGLQLTIPSSQHKHIEPMQTEDKKLYGRQQSSITIYSNLMRFFHTKQFVNRITRRKKMNHMFSSYHFNVLNDKGAIFNQKLFKDAMLQIRPLVQRHMAYQKQKTAFHVGFLTLKHKIQNVGQRISTYGQKLPIFFPETPTMLLWDFLVNIARIYFMIFLPMDLCFNSKDFLFENWVSELMLLLLVVHVFVSFNTAFYEKGSIVSNRGDIIFHVMSKFAGLEIFTILSLLGLWIVKSISTESYQISIQKYPYQLLYLLFLLQYQNVASFFRQFQETFSFSRYVGSLLELFKLILGIIYVLHLFTCIWFWAGEDSVLTHQTSWLEKNGIDHADWSVQYLYSLYFSTVTMFTVGYGDITPQSDVERVISILFMVFSSVQLSYSVNTVGTIIDQISRNEEIKSKNLQVINSYMQNKKISYQLQYQIREYLNYLWQSEKAETCRMETSIIQQLSISLRDKLKIEANKMMFNECILFKHFFSDQLKNYLIRKVIPVVVQPESIVDYSVLVSNRDSQDKIFLCFIEEGQLDVIVENDANIYGYSAEVSTLQKKSEGETLGLVSFISGVKMTEKFRSNQFSKLLLLSRDDFIKVIKTFQYILKTLKDFPEDQEVFYTIQEQLRFQRSSELVKKLNIQCSSCNSCQHREITCPLLHFVPDQEFIIKSLQYTNQQERNQQQKQFFVRTPQLKNQFFNATLDQRQIEEVALDFQKDNSNFTQFYEMSERHSISIDSPFQHSNPQQNKNNLQISIQPQVEDRHKIELCTSPILRRISAQKEEMKFGKKSNEKIKNNIFNVRDQIIESSQESNQNISLGNSDSENENKSSPLNIQQLISRDKKPTLADKIKKNFFFDQQGTFGSVENPKNIILPPLQKVSSTTDQSPSSVQQRLYQTIKTVATINTLKKKFRDEKQQNVVLKKEKIQNLQPVIENPQLTVSCMYEVLNNRIRLLQKYKQSLPSVLLKAFEQGEFTLIKLEMMLSDDKLEGKFEAIKNYKFYFPENNIERVITKQKSYYEINKILIGNLHDVYHRLLQYISYPYIYIEKYKFTQIDQRLVLLPSNNRDAKKVKQELKSTKTQEKRMKQSKRNFSIARKAQQIRPQSDYVRSILTQN